MNNAGPEIDQWLIETSLASDKSTLSEQWDPVFEPDRHLVHIKFGPYQKLYLRPEGFIKRFYHRLYPLPIENWRIIEQTQLYNGFCTFDATLEIRFQSSLKYAGSNLDLLPDINAHIKAAYQDLLTSLIQKELVNLSDGAWVQKGVTEIEKRISVAVSEILILQNIQSQVLCTLKPSFAEFPNVQLAQENVFLCVLKRSFEFSQAKKEELLHQEREIERQNLEHKQRQLEQLNRDAELQRLMQAQEALHKKQLLEDREKQLQEQFELERRLHLETLKHESSLKEIALEAELEEQQQRENRLRIAEQEKQLELLAHQSKLTEKELAAEITRYEVQQTKWLEAKDKVHAQQTVIEQRQKQREIDAELKNQKHHEQQRLTMQKDSDEKRKEFDVYLRREIELLELEKQSLNLQLTIKDAKQQKDRNSNAQTGK